MRKNFGVKPWIYPLPVLIVAAYDETGAPNAMNCAWGGIFDGSHVVLDITARKKTGQNIRATGAFTVHIADAAHVIEADYLGVVTGNKEPKKLEKAGLHTVKSEFVNAPVITEFPMALECRFVKILEDGNVLGEIVNVSADERVLGPDGLIDPALLRPISFDPVHNGYLVLGERVGSAFSDGKKL